MRRGFWVAVGLGAGVAGAVIVSRWLRRQQQLLSPANIGAQVAHGFRDLGELFRQAVEEGRRATREREAEIWEEIDESTSS